VNRVTWMDLLQTHPVQWTCECRLCQESPYGPEASALFVVVYGRRTAAVCWHDAGMPGASYAPPDPMVEQATRARMLKRGGADKYRVSAGKS